MLTLFSYNVSPYAAKVRAVLQYKRLPFEERMVHPLDRGEVLKLSGQIAVPVVVSDGKVVADSTRIVAWLDEQFPDRPVLPRDPALRARALLIEEGFDEGLGRIVQPVRWMIAANARRTAARFRSAYAPGFSQDVRMGIVTTFLRVDMRRKYGSRMLSTPPAAALLERLGELLDTVDAALTETGWLAGPAPSVADFALYGWLCHLKGLDGWELVESRQRVAHLLQALAEPTQPAPSPRDGGDAPRPAGSAPRSRDAANGT
jgi:glutathione S-transferase